MRPMFRPDSPLSAAAMKTYEIVAPIDTHFREASCAEVECDGYRLGWKTIVDESTELGQRQAYYIRRQSRRSYTEERVGLTLTAFTFAAGQRCFAREPHRVRVGRPEIYIVRGGDWRANLGLIRRHASADNWVDDFASHQSKIKTIFERG